LYFGSSSKAIFSEEEASNIEQWLKKGFHGKMHCMENYFDMRLNPRLLVEDAKPVKMFVLGTVFQNHIQKKNLIHILIY